MPLTALLAAAAASTPPSLPSRSDTAPVHRLGYSFSERKLMASRQMRSPLPEVPRKMKDVSPTLHAQTPRMYEPSGRLLGSATVWRHWVPSADTASIGLGESGGWRKRTWLTGEWVSMITGTTEVPIAEVAPLGTRTAALPWA
eukprot:scaffold212718_cov31-Tisochrysis_lutea.AAC.1